MKRTLWKLAGADCQILERSGTESQRSFYVIGILYAIVIALTFIGFFGLFWGLFRSNNETQADDFGSHLLSALIGSSIISFLVSNIYFLNMMSLEPKTLPVREDTSSKIITNFIRVGFITMFAFFVSKNIEMEIFNLFNAFGLFTFDSHFGYMDDLMRMNKENPMIWLITVLIIGLFLFPIVLRKRLEKAHEYYLHRRIIEKDLVLSEHRQFLLLKEEILKAHYAQYMAVVKDKFHGKFDLSRLDTDVELQHHYNFLKSRTFRPHASKFSDEPFNTKLKKKESLNVKDSQDFLAAILQKN
jgi:hypothetical protein